MLTYLSATEQESLAAALIGARAAANRTGQKVAVLRSTNPNSLMPFFINTYDMWLHAVESDIRPCGQLYLIVLPDKKVRDTQTILRRTTSACERKVTTPFPSSGSLPFASAAGVTTSRFNASRPNMAAIPFCDVGMFA